MASTFRCRAQTPVGQRAAEARISAKPPLSSAASGCDVSDELIGLVRETLGEMRELRAEVSATSRCIENLRVEVDARLDEVRRIVTVEHASPSIAKAWPQVVSEVFAHRLIQYALVIFAMGVAGVSVAEIRSGLLGDDAASGDDPGQFDEEGEEP